MKKNSINSKFIVGLAKILISTHDKVFLVKSKYLTIPMRIRNDYKKINAGKKPRIRFVSPPDDVIKHVDKSGIEAIKYYAAAILDFIDVIEKNFDDETLSNFYKNINGIQVGRLPNSKDNADIDGLYEFFRNYIWVKKHSLASIYHELFHMASTMIYKNKVYCGFAIYENEKVIGIGINEGYTELMTCRYFGNSKTTSFLKKQYGAKGLIYGSAYPFQVLIASKLEEIVGRKKMEKLFLNANLHGLVEELSKYASKTEIYDFINKVDFLHNNIEDVYKYSVKSNKVHDAYVQVCDFLIRCYDKKISSESKNEHLNQKKKKNYFTELNSFYDLFFSSYNKKSNGKS